jgi:hypothetical protein
MGRLFALMTGLFPRLALFILWVARLTRIDAAFDTFLLPLLGIIFLPFVTLMYVLLYIPGRAGPDGTGSGSSSPPSSTSGTGAPASPSETRGDARPGGQPWSRTPTVTRCMPVPPWPRPPEHPHQRQACQRFT